MFEPVIGLEIHLELKTKTKMFCFCKNDPEETEPNKNVCPICLGHPGTLPLINKEAVNLVLKAGLSLNCQINQFTRFDRKNYFYPDLPKGYQISQFDFPLCKNGFLEIGSKRIRIRRIHLEEDTGKLIHPEGKDYSLVDFNRAGVPLMELVTEPDIRSGKEAKAFAQELQLIFRYLGISEADMEKGQMRVEVNISLRKPGEDFGTKVEIKNLNSLRSVERAVDYEIKRQTEILSAGNKVIQETRGWDDKKGVTFSQREKEESHDYRYFPEPDLVPFEISEELIEELKRSLPELPKEKRKRFRENYNLTSEAIEFFIQNKKLSEIFEKALAQNKEKLGEKDYEKAVKIATGYLMTDLQGLMRDKGISEKDLKISAKDFADFIFLIVSGKISSKIAKMVLEEMALSGKDPQSVIKDKNLVQITDEGEIKDIAEKVIEENPKAVEDFKKGKENAVQFLLGQIMAKTRGRANPQKAREIILEILKNL